MAQQVFGFVGVGRMGGLMSARLLNDGHKVFIYDVAEDAVAALVKLGAQRCASAAEVAGMAHTVFLSLPNPEIVQRAALQGGGVIEGTKVKRVVDFSTSARARRAWSRKGSHSATSPTSTPPSAVASRARVKAR
jgi:3-hydroxyisobutyrate dehydrogenase